MIVSEARREANRRNALKSTGPKTEEGKGRSRQNALKHGLSAEVVRHPEDGPATRAEAGAEPGSGPAWRGWLASEVITITARLRRCERLDRGHRDRVVLRAELSWDDDRGMVVEALASGLARDPAGVARALRMTPQGCDWMIERWSLLARAADRDRAWTAEQQALAFALLGRPAELGGGMPGEAVDLDGRPIPASFGLDLASVARREVAALVRRKADRATLDHFDRALARNDSAPDDADPALRKLRRHEAALHRRLRWCVARLQEADPEPSPMPMPPPIPMPLSTTRPVPEPDPEPAPIPTPRPRFDPPPVGFEDLDLDFTPFASFEDLMARAEAHLAIDDRPEPEAPAPARPSTPRPDPIAARDKARKAARKAKRGR